MRSVAQKFLPVEGIDKRVDLDIEGDQVVLRLSTWTEGLGWCGQKTMPIEAGMIDEMHRLLGAARVRLAAKRAEVSPDESSRGSVIDFPAAG